MINTAFIMLVCVFIAADSIVQGKEAHVELCIESQYDGKEHWGKIQKTWALILSVLPSRQLIQGLSV